MTRRRVGNVDQRHCHKDEQTPAAFPYYISPPAYLLSAQEHDNISPLARASDDGRRAPMITLFYRR